MNTVLDIVAEYPFILVVGLAIVAAALKKDLFALLQQWFRKRFNVKDEAHIEDIPAELHELNLSQMFVTTVKRSSQSSSGTRMRLSAYSTRLMS